ncbi:DUF6088 family protein [Caballeronia sp. NK8]|uniref:DUF6088 family protein n=1 Tax=Caballeronia sp. NK8 TaxID=140098 RepID=UPI001CEC37D2|nr:DUF6088 family protein [Caballeronia sp. NK8]
MVRASSSTRTRKSTVEQRVLRSLRRRSDVVVLRSDLMKLGGKSQLTRVLAKLVTSRTLIRVGHGIYCKTRQNRFTGRLAPAAPFETIAAEAFRRLGVAVSPGMLALEYNSGRSTQVPIQPIVSTGKRRISRRIEVGSKRVIYEKRALRARKHAGG